MTTLRPAIMEDAPFVAWTVLTALDLPTDDITMALRACQRDDTLYSWRHATLAVDGDKPVGCLVAYEGARYAEMRERTWNLIWGRDDNATSFAGVELETYPGEYYLDSMAILPQYRGKGIGRQLLLHAVEQGKRLGCSCSCSTLIVSTDKPRLQVHYQSIGFTECGSIEFFGHKYNRMKTIRI